MAIPRRKKKPRPPIQSEVAALRDSLQGCEEKIRRLDREIEIHIQRMAAMQAEIDYLLTKVRS